MAFKFHTNDYYQGWLYFLCVIISTNQLTMGTLTNNYQEIARSSASEGKPT